MLLPILMSIKISTSSGRNTQTLTLELVYDMPVSPRALLAVALPGIWGTTYQPIRDQHSVTMGLTGGLESAQRLHQIRRASFLSHVLWIILDLTQNLLMFT